MPSLGDSEMRIFYADTAVEPSIEGDWTEIPSTLSTPTLSSGNYRFHIEASNNSTSEDISWVISGVEEW